MDDFASAVVKQAGWEPESLTAVYHEKEGGGLEALAADHAGLALVTLPFFLRHRETLALQPLLEAVQVAGESEVWSLVAYRGKLDGAKSMDGWTIAGIAGYSPRFVRNVALAEWRGLPDSTEIRFSSRVLTDLRKAAAGEPVAVLLDRGQTEALSSLPFAEDLEVVASSSEMPAILFCAVGGRVTDEAAAEIRSALLRLGETDMGSELLETMRIDRFQALDSSALEKVESAFAVEEDDAE
jgi:ABC-type phosphate/phosphonate transport system substrate-binding protein